MSVNEAKCKRFRDHIDNCRLIDLGSEGPRYTWSGPIFQFASRIYKRLNRGLCNSAWRNEFSEAYIKVGPRLNSDHHPLLIFLESPRQHLTRRPFRFEAAWVQHSEFKAFLGANWKKGSNVCTELQALEPKLQTWNVEVFGHIRKKKNILLRRIEGIQRANQRRDNVFLEDLEASRG